MKSQGGGGGGGREAPKMNKGLKTKFPEGWGGGLKYVLSIGEKWIFSETISSAVLVVLTATG